jgi:hypothetical protein
MMPLAMSHLPGGEPPAIPPKRGWLQLATIDITPLRRHRDFRLLFIGRLVSFFGTMITVVGVPYQVYQLSHSVLLVGFLGLAELAALVGFAMLGGALADAADRPVGDMSKGMQQRLGLGRTGACQRKLPPRADGCRLIKYCR